MKKENVFAHQFRNLARSDRRARIDACSEWSAFRTLMWGVFITLPPRHAFLVLSWWWTGFLRGIIVFRSWKNQIFSGRSLNSQEDPESIWRTFPLQSKHLQPAARAEMLLGDAGKFRGGCEALGDRWFPIWWKEICPFWLRRASQKPQMLIIPSIWGEALFMLTAYVIMCPRSDFSCSTASYLFIYLNDLCECCHSWCQPLCRGFGTTQRDNPGRRKLILSHFALFHKCVSACEAGKLLGNANALFIIKWKVICNQQASKGWSGPRPLMME